jgi:methylamine dehydrogenase accessory protein MauD
MSTGVLFSSVALWLVVLGLAFLLLGALRSLGLLRWRLEQLEATTPSRLGRSGLRAGKKAPDFSLPSLEGTEVSLHAFAGRKVLLVFVQTGCGPCRVVVPELNRIAQRDDVQVLVVSSGAADAVRSWAEEVQARFPVLRQEQLRLSKRYEVFATPFAFLIGEKGTIASKGIINSVQHIGYVLSGAGGSATDGDHDTEPPENEERASEDFHSSPNLKEVHHV